MKKIMISNDKVEFLSDVVSQYIYGLGDGKWIEGAFIMPCGQEEIETLILGIVYNNWKMESRIKQSDKSKLHLLSSGVGIDFQVKGVSFDKCLDDSEYRTYDQPIKGMIKTGYIIYDANGRLTGLQAKFKCDRSIQYLDRRGAVQMEPAIQYKKTTNRF